MPCACRARCPRTVPLCAWLLLAPEDFPVDGKTVGTWRRRCCRGCALRARGIQVNAITRPLAAAGDIQSCPRGVKRGQRTNSAGPLPNLTPRGVLKRASNLENSSITFNQPSNRYTVSHLGLQTRRFARRKDKKPIKMTKHRPKLGQAMPHDVRRATLTPYATACSKNRAELQPPCALPTSPRGCCKPSTHQPDPPRLTALQAYETPQMHPHAPHAPQIHLYLMSTLLNSSLRAPDQATTDDMAVAQSETNVQDAPGSAYEPRGGREPTQ